MTKERVEKIEVSYNDEGDVQVSKDNMIKLMTMATMLLNSQKELTDDEVELVGKYAAALTFVLYDLKKGEKPQTQFEADTSYGIS